MRSSDPTGSGTAPAAYLQLLLADGRLPSGAHTQSAGVEPGFASGLRLEEVPAYLTARLRTVTEVEAATAVVARQVGDTLDPDRRAAELAAVDRAWRVRTPSAALRDASDLLGRGYRRLAERVWPVGLPELPLCRAVVVGAVAGVAGIGPADLARLVGYDDVQMVIGAAMKLRPFDPFLAVRWVAAAGPDVLALADRVADARHPDQIPAHSAPLVEQWAEQHRATERRLFRA